MNRAQEVMKMCERYWIKVEVWKLSYPALVWSDLEKLDQERIESSNPDMILLADEIPGNIDLYLEKDTPFADPFAGGFSNREDARRGLISRMGPVWTAWSIA